MNTLLAHGAGAADSAHRFPEATMSNRDYGFVILLVVALLAAATWFASREPIMQELPASIANAPPPGAGEAFHYYPGQYVNQATEASEHIQAY
jgi:hypothetical protein